MIEKDEVTELVVEVTKALVVAVNTHSEAIRELAQAIREHAYLTAPGVDEDEDDENTRAVYMDGTPVQ